MDGVALFAPLLQLNPPVLVRTNGDAGVIDVAALRRAGGGSTSNGGGGACTSTSSRTSPAPTRKASTATSNSRSTAVASLAARKLHEAKSTARQVSRTGDVPPRAHTTEMPGRRKESMGTQQKAAHAVNGGPRAADRSSCGATGSAPPSPTAAAGRGVAAQPPPTAGLTPFTNEEDPSTPAVTAVAAAAASPGDQNLLFNLPYLMRHIQDTGALLDTLFPLQLPQRLANDGSGSGNEEEAAATEMVSVQTVSAAPASREAVIALHATLRARLEARRARPTGLCGIRRSVYADLFSELVRQVTIEEPARGLLLARVRENEEHALQVHAALLRESENFVAGKLLQETQSVTALMKRLSELREEKKQLEVRKHDLHDERQKLEQLFDEQRQIRKVQQQDELNYLRRANQQLSLRLKMETERASVGDGNGGAEESAVVASSSALVAAS
ncbi:putative 33 kDa inner dynein arm light chain axonemal [Leptomonas pyrrhocoris]|uniref:Putative 33 kDa inner dynein arm light chain axonemal n=1 Tax=Leptomonas pyrrhocoris TaxID=157538 RepID=A0A0M9FV82_LEPPY|nr:putative 33 kDa inner dynein arm light chain axonemal [Leptomonas pyrrhocoris]XP_015655077.1 putative 33 kDa inner dynein arm light chain axonemal [Leptomonas pyrrhocoris]KPA76637.1 putative 33 kDa inner dynein arm light chain axonemal [Leptomonas pyrrhocoris]KPA76638.1 putative 33 kDa inner dynein arm light chain axonemal [Leptomonas pyrrhocoris]|eukprot:XP_015655076.1 putative 33 kDa inner dynein arm light chain axonemal [Leptomonas pyrrhocoris]